MDNKEKLKEIVEHLKNENNPNDRIKLKNINFNNNYNYNDIAKKLIKILYKNHPNNIANLNNFDEEDLDIFINYYYEKLKEQLSAKKINTLINNKIHNKIHNIRGCKIFFSGKQSSPNGKSVGLACGRHALNNLYGGEYFTACINQISFNAATAYTNEELNKIKLNKNSKINLTKFAKTFLNQQELTVKENYDIKILRGVLNRFGQYGIKKQNINSKNKLNYNNINNKDVLGYLIATGGHYSVIKKCGNNWVFLDSLIDAPQIIDIDFLKEKINTVINKNNPDSQIGVYLIKKTTNSNLDNQKRANNLNKTVNYIITEIPSIRGENIRPISQALGANTIFNIQAKIMDLPNYNNMNNNKKEILLYQKIIEEKDKNLANLIKVSNEKNIETLKQLVRLIIKSNFKTSRNKIIENYKTNKLKSTIGQLEPNAQVIGQKNKKNTQKALVKQPQPPPPRKLKPPPPTGPSPRNQLGPNAQTGRPNAQTGRPNLQFSGINLNKIKKNLKKPNIKPKPKPKVSEEEQKILNRRKNISGKKGNGEINNEESEFVGPTSTPTSTSTPTTNKKKPVSLGAFSSNSGVSGMIKAAQRKQPDVTVENVNNNENEWK